MLDKPKLIIFAGANGSGKTTAAEKYLADENAPFNDFINTDKIAEGLSPFNPELARISAGKIFFERFDDFVLRRKSFAFETTLSGAGHARRVKQAKVGGYSVHMIYFYVDDPRLNIERIKFRVMQGGHHVPDEDVKRRYERSLYHLMNTYWDLCDTIDIYDTAYESVYIARKTDIGVTYAKDDEVWRKIKAYKEDDRR